MNEPTGTKAMTGTAGTAGDAGDAAAGGGATGRVLVVDDDAAIRRSLTRALRLRGFSVSEAGGGAAALDLLGRTPPDVLVLDITMPGVDGIEVCRTLRASGSDLPVLVLSARDEVADRVAGLQAGADDYLIKPFHPAELLARIKSLLARFAPKESLLARPPLGRILAFYGAKGGVGTTTIAINLAIALHRELGRKVALVDGNLQFGDHRVFLDLGLDRKSIVDVVTAPSIDADLIKQVMVKHDSGIDLLLAPPSPETAELVRPEHLPFIAEQLSLLYDYTLIDIDKRLDDVNLGVFEAADAVFVVMTADLSCLKNVRLILETMEHLGYPNEKVQLVLNRSNAFTGINVKNAEGALKRTIDHQVVNEYRGAISALNSGAPFMFTKADSALGGSVLQFARSVDKPAVAQPATARAGSAAR
jgi:pilus assembly protein CpaE